MRVRRSGTPEQRFHAFIKKRGSCWLWTGYLSKGYGRFSVNGSSVRAHRWAYEHFVGPIPEGMVLDHLCRVTRCVNPSHLEPVPQAENALRGLRGFALTGKCRKGLHPIRSEDDYYDTTSGRICRECERIRNRKQYQARKLAASMGR